MQLEFSKLCVTFGNGYYNVYFNGDNVFNVFSGEYAVNSQVAATLGYVNPLPFFYGYIDDVSE